MKQCGVSKNKSGDVNDLFVTFDNFKSLCHCNVKFVKSNMEWMLNLKIVWIMSMKLKFGEKLLSGQCSLKEYSIERLTVEIVERHLTILRFERKNIYIPLPSYINTWYPISTKRKAELLTNILKYWIVQPGRTPCPL